MREQQRTATPAERAILPRREVQHRHMLNRLKEDPDHYNRSVVKIDMNRYLVIGSTQDPNGQIQIKAVCFQGLDEAGPSAVRHLRLEHIQQISDVSNYLAATGLNIKIRGIMAQYLATEVSTAS